MPAIGDFIYGGYFAGWMDTTTGNIIAADNSQVGQRYMLIISPKSLQTGGLNYKTTATAAPVTSNTRWNGLAATAGMTGTTYPLSNYCNGLTYPADGGSQWYMPAMDELELIYRNLKPAATANTISARNASGFPNAGGMGQNVSSDPAGSAYTSGVPAQITTALFQSGGAQASQYSFSSSTQQATGAVWTQSFSDEGTDGYQVAVGVTSNLSVRPVRRITNLPPNAPTLNSPATGSTVDRTVTQRLGWVFSDPIAGDSQSKFDLQYKLGAGAWVPITGTTPNNFWDAPPATFSAGSYEWQVRTYDSFGVVGPYSASSFFTAADTPGVPSITTPTSGSTVGLATATVTWSVGAQTDYQVRKVADLAGAPDTSTVYYDSGDVVDSVTRSVILAFPVNGRWDHIQVRVKAAGLWSTWADCRVLVSYTAPMVPTVVATPFSAGAEIDVAITNPAPTGGEPPVTYNDIYISSPLDPEQRLATMVAPNSTWPWKTPAAGRLYTIRAVAVGSNGTTTTSI